MRSSTSLLPWLFCSSFWRMQVYFPTFAVHVFSTASVVEIKNSRGMDVSKCYRCTQVKASKGEKEEEDLLSKASRLRKEAEELEAQLRSTSTKKPAQSTTASSLSSAVTPVYKSIGDSYWTFSYRFATEPESDDESTVSPKYGGKLTLHLKSDGFTDLIAHEPSVPNKALNVVKAWGWDLEKSEEDEKEYVLFSIDVVPPDSSQKVRCYFQARQERDGTTGSIELKEGTVTVKQDVTETKDGRPSFWGFFSPKGILARFTYVGDFVARAAAEAAAPKQP